MNISVVSGGFDPIHSGHISYINAAKKYGDHLIIALNSDDWSIFNLVLEAMIRKTPAVGC